MSLSLSKEELIKIVSGRSASLEGDGEKIVFQGVEFDSREITGGELFVAMPGDKAHGHDYLPQAFERGASMALVEDEALLSNFPEPERLVLVSDVLKSFWKLAGWWRAELQIPVIGITGSVGKTTVKELTAAILMRHSVGSYSRKSFNNHVGLPYTICQISRDHEWAVLEMGMSHPGEIRVLTEIARPNVGVITNIAAAHIEGFATLDEVADAKFEIIEGMDQGNLLILNREDEMLAEGLKRHDPDGARNVKYFGISEEVSARVSDFTPRGFDGISFQLALLGETLDLEVGILGEHNASNAAVAALAAKSLIPELSAESIREALARFTAPLMRLNVHHLSETKTVIDDTYNANPASMRAALEIARQTRAKGLRVGLILGDMLELGEASAALHREIGEVAAEVEPEFLVAVGEFAGDLTESAAQSEIPVFEVGTPEAAAHTARKYEFDVLLVKGSRGVALDRAVQTILEMERQ